MMDFCMDMWDMLEHSFLMKMYGEILELFRITPLITKGGWSRYDETGDRNFIKKYRGYDIYSMYGKYSETVYTTSIVTEHCFASGENYYGKGFFVFAVDSDGVYSDNSITESYWVRVKSAGMNPSVNSERLVKKGIEKAVRKVESGLDWHIAFIQKLREQDEREKQSEKKVVDAVSKGQ